MVTLGHAQHSEYAHSGVPLPGGVGHVEVLHRIIGPIAEPQVLANESNVLDEVDQENHGGVDPAHGTQVLDIE